MLHPIELSDIETFCAVRESLCCAPEVGYDDDPLEPLQEHIETGSKATVELSALEMIALICGLVLADVHDNIEARLSRITAEQARDEHNWKWKFIRAWHSDLSGIPLEQDALGVYAEWEWEGRNS